MIFSPSVILVLLFLWNSIASSPTGPSLKRRLETDASDFIESDVDKQPNILELVDITDTVNVSNIIQSIDQCDPLDSVLMNILERSVQDEKRFILELMLSPAIPCNAVLFLEALKLAGPSFRPKICSLAYPHLITAPAHVNELINFLLFSAKKDFYSFEVLLEKKIDFSQWRNAQGQTLSHILVSYDLVRLAVLCDPFNLTVTDNFGFTPIFYATSAKMVKALRRSWPLLREAVDSKNQAVWQKALKNKNYAVLDALISFDARLKKFRKQFLNYFNILWVVTASLLTINRSTILVDSFNKIQHISDKWYLPRNKFFIKFIGEIGMDGGGVKVDWMNSLLRAIFEPKPLSGEAFDLSAPLFIEVDEESRLLAPNPQYPNGVFRFVGSIFGVAMAMRIPLKVRFIPSFYRLLMDESIDPIEDLKEQSPSFFRSFQALRDPKIKISELDLYLLSNPKHRVTRRSVETYITEASQDILFDRYFNELNALKEGFESVLTFKLNDFFISSKEIKSIMTGRTADYTGAEFIEHAACENQAYRGFLTEIIDEFTPSQRCLFLKFITGMHSIPLEGFAGIIPNITVAVNVDLFEKLPTSSTCTFSLFLPPHLCKEALKQVLITAIEGTDSIDREGTLTEADGIVLEFPDEETEFYELIYDSDESDISQDEVEENSSDEEVILL